MVRLAILLIGLVVIPPMLIVCDGLTDDIAKTEVAVVLGNQVKADGQPSDRLRARLDRALKLYEDELVGRIIVSGGIGAEGYDEAAVMREYLIAQGVPAADIIADSAGVNTSATAQNAAAIMSEAGWQSATVVTQYFHIPRARMALKRAGVDPVRTAHAHFFELRDYYSTAREVIGYGAYWVGYRD